MSRALREGGGEGEGLETFADCDQRGETGGHAPGRGAQGDQGKSRIYAAHRDTPRPYAHCGVAGQCAERVSLDRRDRTRESRASAFVFLTSFIHTRAGRRSSQAATGRDRQGGGGGGVSAERLVVWGLGRARAREKTRTPRTHRTHTHVRARGAAESSRRGRDSFSQKELTSHARRLGALEHATRRRTDTRAHGHERPHTQWAVPCAASKRVSMASRRHPRKRQYKSHPARKSFCEKQRRRQSAEGIKGRTADSGIGYRRLGSRGSRQWRGAHLRAQ